jgi:dipeptidyl aminopeptidase/acylaminoacyl peptidase
LWLIQEEGAEQIVAVPKTQQVPVEFLRSENEGHFMLQRDTQLFAYPAASQWFARYMWGCNVASDAPAPLF